jgi:hypothetical protein
MPYRDTSCRGNAKSERTRSSAAISLNGQVPDGGPGDLGVRLVEDLGQKVLSQLTGAGPSDASPELRDRIGDRSFEPRGVAAPKSDPWDPVILANKATNGSPKLAVRGSGMTQESQRGRESKGRREALWAWLGPRWLPAVLVIAGIAGAAWIGYRSRSSTPPTATEASLLVVISGTLNIAGAALFAKVGRADPRHARSAVRRLLSVGQTLAVAHEELAQTSPMGKPELQTVAQVVDAHILDATREIRSAIEDWNDIHGEALREVLEAAKGGLGPQ